MLREFLVKGERRKKVEQLVANL